MNLNKADELNKLDAKLFSLTSFLSTLMSLEPFQAPVPLASDSSERMIDSLIINDNRIYEGQTNALGQPQGLGILIDFSYRALFEGFFTSGSEE